jgi:aryl-alcohol dehydrogenase-like predicted oxidoreductase
MDYGTIPHLDRKISRIVMGTDFLAGQGEASYASLDRFWELGGNAFDSAQVYRGSTEVLGDWLAARGLAGEAVFFDKGCHPLEGEPKRVTYEAMGADIRQEHERLRVGYTDLFVLHRDDPEVPVGEIIDWLNDYRDQGLIGAFGGSNWHYTRIAEANEWAAANGRQGFSLDNPNLTLAENVEPLWPGCITIDREGREWHEQTQLPLFAWASMARGYFVGVDDPEVLRAYDSPVSRARRERAEQLGRERGFSVASVAMAWVLAQPFPVFALAGLRAPEQVDDTLRALELELTPEDVRWLEEG